MNVKGIDFSVGQLPSLTSKMIGSRDGICLVLGSSPSVFKDIKDAVSLIGARPFDVMACNLSYLAWTGKIDHLVSLHQEKLKYFEALAYTIPCDRPAKIMTHGSMECDSVECAWPISDLNGTSSLFCIKIAYLMGYKKIVVCGVSLEGHTRFYDNHLLPHNNNMGCSAIEVSWHEYKWLPYRAMSGKPMIINGMPTEEWLK